MTFLDALRNYKQADEDGVMVLVSRQACDEAIAEIERLREVLVTANNNWRHDFSRDVEEATDKLFKKLAAHRTDPFARKQP